MSSNKSFSWTQFFRDAGIPLPIAKRYSLSFEDNRISRDMLMDLNKEILTEMDITAMGDVINILKHAKKTHAQELKKREKESVISTSAGAPAISNKRPPATSPHSTTSGQGAAAVSTTSTAINAKKRVAKRLKKEVPEGLDGEGSEVTYIAYVEPSNVLQPRQTVRTAQLYTALKGQPENLQEAAEPVSDEEEDLQESYVTAKYEASHAKRMGKMYSDDLMEGRSLQSNQQREQQQQARVIMLPGEGRDIFTTTALQKAAKVYESGAAQEGGFATDRSRRLLESAGLIPSKVKDTGHSVFSRLDYKPSVSFQTPPLSSSTPKLAALTHTSQQRRIMQLSKPSTTTLYSDQLATADVTSSASPLKQRVISVKKAPHATTLYSDQLATGVTSSVSPLKKRVISIRPAHQTTTTTLYSDQMSGDRVTSSIPPPKKRVISVSQPTRVSGSSRRVMPSTTSNPFTRIPLGNRLVSDSSPQTLTGRLGTRERGKRSNSSVSQVVNYPPSSTVSLGSSRIRTTLRPALRQGAATTNAIKTTSKKTGIFGYEREGRGGGGRVEARVIPSHAGHKTSTMVADEYEYQARRHHDIRSRLEKKEREKAARRGGPLAGRLGSHKVFRRLE